MRGGACGTKQTDVHGLTDSAAGLAVRIHDGEPPKITIWNVTLMADPSLTLELAGSLGVGPLADRAAGDAQSTIRTRLPQ